MCGRYLLSKDLQEIADAFDVDEITCESRGRGEVFPGQPVVAIIYDGLKRLVEFQWGLIPSWAKDSVIGYKMINARSETVSEKPAFREPFQRQRCLIIADGFFEWQREGKKKTRFHFSLKSGEPFAFAGLYDIWQSPQGQSVKTCTIITTPANELIAPIHDRMPAMIAKAEHAHWLHPVTSRKDLNNLHSLLQPYPPDQMNIKIE